MKIGIAGYGFVGKAHELILKDYHDIIISDPKQGYYGDLRHADAIIICVSTPSNPYGYCDVTNVSDVLDDGPDVPYLIKSTMSIEGWNLITDCCKNKNICFSPEFLRAEHWETDALMQDHIYLGGDGTSFWSDLLINALGPISISVVDPKELIAAKQLRNSFLALKVTFFNQVKDFCDRQDIDFESVRKVVTDDHRINASHSLVTEARGFGGHCLPKDVLATIRSGELCGGRISILEHAQEYNNNNRKGTI